ncbi:MULTISPECIES: 5' nucleotidase, NT5C type [Caproicibacterium]|uniref:Toprim domain-containing protein n=1 Tax=Caproicibacterium argilliputei TaxID=3030016 RepID=A0AA97H3K1_9FIRM|nr:toprim domain-containing protein [Caproicibacterium argilliputei]WOC32373.1 toprim domain-containing protein [Caproicibacterium argilliputei]
MDNEKRAKIAALTGQTKNLLSDAAAVLQEKPAEIAQTLAFASRFPTQSFNNAVLLHSQMPTAQYVASFAQWKQLGYAVKRGQKGLHVIRPHTERVFVVQENGMDVIHSAADASPEEKAAMQAGTLQTKVRTSYAAATVFDVSQTVRTAAAKSLPSEVRYSPAQLLSAFSEYAEQLGCSITDIAELSQTEKLATLADRLGNEIAGNAQFQSVSVRDFSADALSLMFRTRAGLPLTDTRMQQFTQYYNDCQSSRFNLNHTLRAVSDLYASSMAELALLLEQVRQSPEAIQAAKLEEERRRIPEQISEQQQKAEKAEIKQERAAAITATAEAAASETVVCQRIFVNLTGTLCQFRPNATPHQLQQPGFFRGLSPYPNVVDAVHKLAADPSKEVFILSSALHPASILEKNQWLNTYLPQIDNTHRLFPTHGTELSTAVPGGVQNSDVLLDDYTRNLQQWPGQAIKLISDINQQHGSWTSSAKESEGAAVRYDRPADGLVQDIDSLIQQREHLPDMTLAERQTYLHTVRESVKETVSVNSNSSPAARKAMDTLLRGRNQFPCNLTDGTLSYFPFANQEQYETLLTPTERSRFDALIYDSEAPQPPEKQIVHSQEELNAVQPDTPNQLVLGFGNAATPAEIRQAFLNPVLVPGSYSANVYENAQVEAHGAARIHAFGNSVVHAFDSTSVEANEQSTVIARQTSNVRAGQESTVHALDRASVQAFDHANAILHDTSTAELRGESHGAAYDRSSLRALEHSHAVRAGNSRVAIQDTATVERIVSNQQAVSGTQWIVRSQAELDQVPPEYPGAVLVNFGTPETPAQISQSYIMPVSVIGSHVAEAFHEAKIVARDTAQITARDASTIYAMDLSQVNALDNSHVFAKDGSSVFLHDASTAEQADSSIVLNQHGHAETGNEVRKVTTQEELNAVPEDYNGRIVVNFGTEDAPAQIAQNYAQPVLVPDKYVAAARNDSHVHAADNASVYAFENSRIVGYGSSYLELNENSVAELYEQAVGNLYGTATAIVHDTASLAAYEESTVEAHGSSTVDARDHATVDAYEFAQVSANNAATVRTHGDDVVTKMHGGSVLTPAESASTVVAHAEPEKVVSPAASMAVEKEPEKLVQQQAPHETPQPQKKTYQERRAEWDRQKAEETDFIKHRVNILDVAEDLGYTVTRQGLHDSLQEHDSVVFYPSNTFSRFSRTGPDGQVMGGSTVDFVMHFDQEDGLGLGIHNAGDAIKYLKERYMGISAEQTYHPRQQKPRQPEKKPFRLPEKSADMRKAVQYLHHDRGISSSVIEQCTQRGLLYQNKGMAIFVGMNAQGKAVYAARQGTEKPQPGKRSYKCDVAGSDQHVGWYVDNHADKLYVTEAPIDAMSLMTLREQGGHDAMNSNYLALNGTSKAYILYERLKADPSIKSVVLALDNDKAGLDADQKIQDYMHKNLPNVSVSAWKVPEGKDVNEYLLCKKEKARSAQQDQPTRTMPQPAAPQMAANM